MSDTAALNPIESTDPAALVALFDADPSTIPAADLDRLIAEYRRRADVNKAEAAAAAAAPKPTRKTKVTRETTPEAQALADKPIGEVSVDDLF